MVIDKFGQAWGLPGAPLLPATLRTRLATEPLPPWMARDLKLEGPATFSRLDSSATPPGAHIPERVVRAITFLLTSRREQFSQVRCIERPWPAGLAPEAVPWSTRTRNSLRKGGVLRTDGIDPGKTFGDIFAINGAGVTTALDYAATLESSMDDFERIAERAVAAVTPDSSAPDQEASVLGQLLEEPWAAQIGGADPRFPELAQVEGSLQEYVRSLLDSPDVSGRAEEITQLLNNLPMIRRKVDEMAKEPLEKVLNHLLGALRPMEPKRFQALSDRLGWSGRQPKTLEEAAKPLGVTRERLRQIEDKILKRLPKDLLLYAPALDRAIAEISKAAPISVEEAAKLLQRAGISERAFHPEALISAANHLGREHELAITHVRGKLFVVSAGTEEPVRIVSRLVRQLSGMSGAFSVYQLQRECAKADAPFDADKLRPLLASMPRIVQLDANGDWWRMTGIPIARDRLLNQIFKMLSVASPQTIRSLREGVARVYRWRSCTMERYRDNLIVPPGAVIAAVLKDTQQVVLAGDLASLRDSTDYRTLIGEAERILVDVLRSSSTGLLDRTSLARQCLSRGMSEASFGVLTTYSPLVEHPAPGIWKLRGTVVDPAAVEAASQAFREAPRERRILNYGWTRDGRIWIAARIPEFSSSLVVGIPGPLFEMLGGKSFPATFPDGLSCGTVTTSRKGESREAAWGFSPFIRMAALEEGDVMKMTFNLKTDSVILEQVDESSLED